MTDQYKAGIGQRLKEVRQYKKLTLEQFYGPITPFLNNLSAVENGSRQIGPRLSKDIIEYHHINPGWLATGEGEMFSAPAASVNNVEVPANNGVPYFDIDVSGRKEAGVKFHEEQPEYYVNYKPFNDCTAYLPVYGDSMYPKYASGEIIAVKKLNNLDVLLWGEAYLVIGDQGANNLHTVKLVFEHPDPAKLVLRASNPNYKGDTVIAKQDILALYIVKGKITRNQI